MDFAKVFSLSGKVIVVTGAASGIGHGVASFLREAGASVVLTDLDKEKGEKAAREMGEGAFFLPCNVTSNEDCRALGAALKEKFGAIQGLVNCAGVIRRKNSVDLEEKDWDISIDVSLKGTWLVSKYLLPLMMEKGGSVVNIGSGWGIKGGPNAVSYCAAKGGIVNMTRAMCIDHGARNIRVNCVSPGDVDTPLLRSEAVQLGLDMDAWLRESADRPLGRIGTPEDIAKAVYFLVSDLSTWVSGANLVVDGGGTA